MSQPTSPFNDPEIIHLKVPQIRQYWAHLLRNCIDKYAQEHPLYVLFSSVLSTLSKVTCASDGDCSPSTAGGTFLFSYPQCRVVDKTAVGRDEYSAISAYPDFGLLHATITKLSDGHVAQLEQIKLLVEVKRLYQGSEANGWFWTDGENACNKLKKIISLNFRQLILQAYCTFEAYGDDEVHIMLIVGIYFTLFRFSRPDNLEPLPQESDPRHKRQKFETGDSRTGKPKWKAAKHIDDSRLADLIPPKYISVFYPNAPVFANARDWDLQLSDAFRLALNDRLNEVKFQPCSLFDVRGAQYTPNTEYLEIVEGGVVEWYTTAESKRALQTPPNTRSDKPYRESPTGIEQSPETPGYKGRAFGVGTRKSLPRAAKRKIVVDPLTSISGQGDDGGPGVGEPSGMENAGLQEGFGDEDVTESAGGVDRLWKGKRKAAGV